MIILFITAVGLAILRHNVFSFVWAFLCLIKQWMVFLFFPTMTVRTDGLIHTAFMVFCDKSTWLPILANYIAIISENIWFSSEILPIMGIRTVGFVMLFVKWTPLSFIIKQIKIQVFFHFMNQSGFKFFCIVGKRTIISIFAFTQLIRVFGAVS